MKQLYGTYNCFNCKTCCIFFNEQEAKFAPLFTNKEKDLVLKKGQGQFFKKHGNIWQALLLKNIKYFYCPFLNLYDWCCRIYEYRPFDCRIYPYIIMWNKERKTILLGFHEGKCPIHESNNEKKLSFRKYMKKYLNTQKMAAFLRNHPDLIWPYDADFVDLFEIELLSSSFHSKKK